MVAATAEAGLARTGRVDPAQDVVVVVDDDYVMRLSCRQILAKMGFRVELFEDGSAGLEGIARLKPALVVVDLKMPGISGMDVISRTHEIDPEIVILVITGYATISTAVDAMKQGAYDFLPKPFSPDELRLVVNRGMERRRLVLESRQNEIERELLRRRFVTFVSHQLQTPLVAVHQYLDVLQRLEGTPDAEAKRKDWMERCIRRTEEMQALIRDWLLLAQVESGSLMRSREPVDLNAIIPDILQTYEELARSGGVTLVADTCEGPCEVLGDRNGLIVLLDNLVVNAIKYNRPGGTVTVVLGRAAGEIVVSVVDTGMGIPEQDLPFLFDEFFRVRDGAARPAGTGLGLPICRRIVSELGGTIGVTSEENVGSTFCVRLPAGPTPSRGDEQEES
ncbi:MAG TPA: hybrid sensor histidine kinase/response regulator [Longimicrobiales bacterium]|nr:hybrid sensor histidine kinase/response regulator [Longimicrobiales bacterium]